MKIIEDSNSRNVILYAPKDYFLEKLKPKPVSDSIKMIDYKI